MAFRIILESQFKQSLFYMLKTEQNGGESKMNSEYWLLCFTLSKDGLKIISKTNFVIEKGK